jgi:thiazole synthase ThiGH ThiG subunit
MSSDPVFTYQNAVELQEDVQSLKTLPNKESLNAAYIRLKRHVELEMCSDSEYFTPKELGLQEARVLLSNGWPVNAVMSDGDCIAMTRIDGGCLLLPSNGTCQTGWSITLPPK